ncbi:MAG: ATP-grasp domain-containing protein [Chloroflexi bacterium]|nr:ATP-grasp domain-containing protein [Chloroflexota bacterium]
MKRIRRILIANRGEIAVRIIRTCRELGIATVAVYSDADRGALHVRLADEAYPIGPAPARESYLAGERIVAVGTRTGCDAVHPGYGFLSENADFAALVADAGLAFVGPPTAVQRALGEKTSARRLAKAAGVAIAEGSDALADEPAARAAAERIGYPVLLKPAGGGGGKGMRIVRGPDELALAWRGATGEAGSAFGVAALFVERYLEHARHVEMQIFADTHGNIVWLGERDCSIQRRQQKLVEETPGPAVSDELRARLGASAVAIARAAGYVNAGTAEFLVDQDGRAVFLEMNTRLQVEHPITELATGLDLVALQLRVAQGEALPFTQDAVERRGAAIELRITAEDPSAGFLPSAGRVSLFREPAGPGVRVDHALFAGSPVPTEYDPLLAKLVCWGPTREVALARARRAVRETIVAGVPTSLPFHARTLVEPDFASGRYDTGYVASHWPPPAPLELDDDAAVAAGIVAVLTRASRAPAHGERNGQSRWDTAAREDALR